MKTCIITLLLACATLFSLAQKVVQSEYFIDKDKGLGKNIKLKVTLAADSSFMFNINLTNVKPGFHRLYVRTKDNNNKWSLTARKTIEVFPSETYPSIAGAEYFVDTDPGKGKASAIVISPVVCTHQR